METILQFWKFELSHIQLTPQADYTKRKNTCIHVQWINESCMFCFRMSCTEHTSFLIFLLFHLKALNNCNTLSVWTNIITQDPGILLAFFSNFKLFIWKTFFIKEIFFYHWFDRNFASSTIYLRFKPQTLERRCDD